MATTDNWNRRLRRLGLLAGAALAGTAALAQTAREDAALMDKPEGASVVQRIKAATPVKLLKRQGFWVEVEAGGKTGWLKVSSLSFASGGAGPTAIDTGRLGQSNIVATSAARGLSAKDLLSGKPDFDEVARLDAAPPSAPALPAFLGSGGVVAATQRIQLVATAPAAAPGAAAAPAPAGTAPPKKKGDDDW